jgi:hypothetical protein
MRSGRDFMIGLCLGLAIGLGIGHVAMRGTQPVEDAEGTIPDISYSVGITRDAPPVVHYAPPGFVRGCEPNCK